MSNTRRVVAGGPHHLEVIEVEGDTTAYVFIETHSTGPMPWEFTMEQVPCLVRRYRHAHWPEGARVLVHPTATQDQIAEACEDALRLGIS